MAEKKLAVVITGDAKGARKAFGEVESASGGLQSKLTKVGGGITTAFKGAAVGATLIGGGLAVFGNQLLTSGAKVSAWRQKTNVVFEGQAADVRKWADKNNEAFGLTDDELAGLAASFGDLLKPMGFTAGQAADMSTKVVGLSGALSSWSGGTVSAAEASDILAKAMLGETDGLKSLGIAISAADIDARLAAKGQDKLTGAALAQAKAVATQELIFEKSTDAQKAWSDGGNKALLGQNKLKAVIAEVKETIATGLTPVLAAAAGWLGDKLPVALASARDFFDQVKPTALDVASALMGVVDSLRPVFEAIASFITSNPAPVLAALGAVAAAAFGAWAVSAGAAAVATIAAAAPVLLLVGAIALLAGGLVYAYQHFEGFRTVVDGVAAWLTGTALPAIQSFAALVAEGFGKLVGWVQAHWDQIKGYIEGAINTVAAVVGGVIDGLKVAWQTWGDELVTIAQTMWGYIKGTVENGINLVKGVIDVVMGIIRGDWSQAWDGIKGILGAVWDQIKLAVETGIGLVKSVLSGAWDAIKLLASTAWSGIKGVITDALDAVVWFVLGLPAKITTASAGLFDGIKNAFKSAINWVIRAWNGLEFKIPGFDPPGPGPTFGGFTLGMPDIPEFHKGGAVPGGKSSEVLSMLQGGEVVLDRGTVSTLAAGRGGSQGGLTIIVQGHVLDGRELGRLAAEGLNEYGASQNGPIIATGLVGAGR